MKIVHFSVRRAVTTGMFLLALVVFGVVSFDRLAVNLLPDITYPSLTIRTMYEGAAPSEVEDVITRPIEEAVGVVENIVRVSSISRAGESYVILEFAWKTNMDFASLNVREKLDLIQLPATAVKPILLKYDPSTDPILRFAVTGNMPLSRARLICEDKIKPFLENLEGVAAVKVNGGLEEEIYVELDAGRLDTLRIPITQVSQRLAAENINLTGGTLDEGRRRFLVRTLSQFRGVDEIGQVIVARQGGANILVRDIGRVYAGHKDRTVITKLGQEEVIELAVYKAGDANAVRIAEAVRERLAEVMPNVNTSGVKLELTTVMDQSTFIQQAVDEVVGTAAQGGLLAIIVLFLFLRDIKSTAIISLSIPISIVVTFFLMYLSDITLNIMSLGGLALGVGMLVDSSIVVLESIQRFREEGCGVLEAALKGASDVGTAVLASTLTTICVFVPIIFVEGVAGQLFADLALTVTFSLAASLVVSLTLIPMLSSRRIDLRDPSERVGASPAGRLRRIAHTLFTALPARILSVLMAVLNGLWRLFLAIIRPATWTFETAFAGLRAVYERLIDIALRHSLITALLAVGILGASLTLYPMLGQELLPEVRQGQFILALNRAEGTPIDKTQESVDLLAERFAGVDGVAYVYTLTGLSAQSGVSVEQQRENAAQLLIQLDPEYAGDGEADVLDDLRELIAPLPGLDYKFSRPTFFSFKTPIEVYLQGYNLPLLRDLSIRLKDDIARIDGLTDLKTSAEAGNPEVQVIFNRERLASYGLTVQGVAQFLRAQVLGDVATEFVRPERKVDIRVRLVEPQRQSLDQIRNLKIQDSAGNSIPLLSVARLDLAEGPAEIRRYNQQRVALISGNLERRDLSSVVRDIRYVLEGLILPPGFTAFVGGQSEEQAIAFQSMTFAVLLAIFLVYLVMASQFESLLQPFIIMFSIPFSVVGVLLALVVTGQMISVVVFIGAIILAGIVVNNAIVLLDCINHLRAGGLNKREAVIRGCMLRFRPILMTTATTILGLLPMALSQGQGAELRIPIAISVIGGLASSTLLTLVLVPVLYNLVIRERSR